MDNKSSIINVRASRGIKRESEKQNKKVLCAKIANETQIDIVWIISEMNEQRTDNNRMRENTNGQGGMFNRQPSLEVKGSGISKTSF